MSVDVKRLEQLRSVVKGDPTSDQLAELLLLLSQSPSTRAEARELCYRALAENPHNHTVRLSLARLYYLDGLAEFCVRELLELQSRAGEALPSLKKILDSFGDYVKQFNSSSSPSAAKVSAAPQQMEQKVVAELDLDADFTDLLEELEEEGDVH